MPSDGCRLLSASVLIVSQKTGDEFFIIIESRVLNVMMNIQKLDWCSFSPVRDV